MKRFSSCLRGRDNPSGRWISVLWLMVLIPGLIMGCGKKADPMPLRLSVPQVVNDLRAERTEEGIVLQWTAAISEGSFRILRSEQYPEEEICVDCPRNYVVISELTANDPKAKNKGSGVDYSWIDTAVKKENRYAYQVIVCNASGFCGGPSNIADAVK